MTVVSIDPAPLAVDTAGDWLARRAAMLASELAPSLPAFPLTLSRAPVFVRVIPEGVLACEPVQIPAVPFPLAFIRDIGHGLASIDRLTGLAPVHSDGPDYAEGLSDVALDLEAAGFVGTLCDIDGGHAWPVPAPRVDGICASDPDGMASVWCCHTCRNTGECRDA